MLSVSHFRRILTIPGAKPWPLFFTSIILWFHSIATAKLRLGELGLIDSLPITFFAGTTVLTISFLLSIKEGLSSKALSAHLMLLVAFLYVTPILIEGTPRFISVYVLEGSVDYLVRITHLNPSLTNYMQWSGATLLGSFLLHATGLNMLTLMLLTPILLQTARIFGLAYLISRFTSKTEVLWLALWLFYLSDWMPDYVFLPQNFALTIYIFGLAIAIDSMLNNKRNESLRAKLIVIVSGLTFTTFLSHPFSGVILLINMLVLAPFVGRRWFKMMVAVSVVLASLFLWKFEVIRLLPLSPLFGFNSVMETLQSLSVSLSRSPVVNGTRIIFGGFVLSLALANLLLVLTKKGRDKKGLSILVLLLSMSSLILVVGWGGESYVRLYSHALPLVAYTVFLRTNKRKLLFLLIPLLITAPFLHIISNYGNEAFDHIPAGKLSAYEFLAGQYEIADTLNRSKVGVTSVLGWPLVVHRNMEKVSWVPLAFFFKSVGGRVEFRSAGSHYIVEDEKEAFWATAWSFGNASSPEWMGLIRRSVGYNRIYTNGEQHIYRDTTCSFLDR